MNSRPKARARGFYTKTSISLAARNGIGDRRVRPRLVVIASKVSRQHVQTAQGVVKQRTRA